MSAAATSIGIDRPLRSVRVSPSRSRHSDSHATPLRTVTVDRPPSRPRTAVAYPGGRLPGDHASRVGIGASPTMGLRGASGTAVFRWPAGEVRERVSAAPRTAPAIADATDPLTLLIGVTPRLEAARSDRGLSPAPIGRHRP